MRILVLTAKLIGLTFLVLCEQLFTVIIYLFLISTLYQHL